MGGSKARDVPENIVSLCHQHHEDVTLHRVKDEIRQTPVGRYYVRINEHDAIAYPLGESRDGGENAEVGVGGIDGRIEVGVLPSSPGASSGAFAAPDTPVDTGRIAGHPAPASVNLSPLTFRDNGIEFEQEITFGEWKKAADRVKSESVGRQWRVGDLVNAGEDRWAEAEQYLDELGYPQETQANFANVARAFALEQRRPLPFTYHQTCYKRNDRFALLDKALAQGWDREQLREMAIGPRKKVILHCPNCGHEGERDVFKLAG